MNLVGRHRRLHELEPRCRLARALLAWRAAWPRRPKIKGSDKGTAMNGFPQRSEALRTLAQIIQDRLVGRVKRGQFEPVDGPFAAFAFEGLPPIVDGLQIGLADALGLVVSDSPLSRSRKRMLPSTERSRS